MESHTFRLKPEEDVFLAIEGFVEEKDIEAGAVMTCVGSLRVGVLRLADREKHALHTGPFEIVSLVGTVSTHGSHLHLSISDQEGHTFGGHLVNGCRVYTTAEIVLVTFSDQVYVRELCHEFGYPELVVHERR